MRAIICVMMSSTCCVLPPNPVPARVHPFPTCCRSCLQPRGFVAAAQAAVREYLGPSCVPAAEQLLDFEAVFAITEPTMPIVLISTTDHTLPFLQQVRPPARLRRL